jgi:MFS family permease
VLVFGRRVGLKPLFVGGSLVNALQYLPLAWVTGVDGHLLAYCVITGIGDPFYWTSYHAYNSVLGDDEHRGHQISAGIALSAVAGVVGPLVGAWLLVAFGPLAAFGTAGLIQAASALALLSVPNVAVPESAPGAVRAALPGVGLFMSDGWLSVTYFFVWTIALFQSLDENVSAYGGAVALAALVGAVSGLLLGKHIDSGHGRRATFAAYFVVSVTLIVRMIAVDSPWLAVFGNALGAFANCLLGPAQVVPVYVLAKQSPCALRFHIASEGGWDVGCLTSCLFTAFLIAHGASLAAVMPLAFVGVAAQLYLLRRSYRRLEAW